KRIRAVVPEAFSPEGVYKRLVEQEVGDGHSIKISVDGLSEEALSVLMEYLEAGFLEIHATDDNGLCIDLKNVSDLARVPEERKYHLLVTKKKEGGIYNRLVPEAVEAMQYRLRGVGMESQAMCELDKSRVVKPANIGNVPAGGWEQPHFMRRIILAAQFPGFDIAVGGDEENLLSRGIRSYSEQIPEYPPTGGFPEFVDFAMRQAERMAKKQGANSVLEEKGIVPTSGAANAIIDLRMAVAGGCRVVHLLPSYPPQYEFEERLARIKDPNARALGSSLIPNREAGKWDVNFGDLDAQLSNPDISIGVISVVNPGNPTGEVLLRDDMVKIFELAKKHGCVVECDETYWQLVRKGVEFVSAGVLSAQMGVPAVVYRSISKDICQCGGKFGWMEFYNPNDDPRMEELRDACYRVQMEKVGATSLPQLTSPRIYEHPEFPAYLEGFNRELFGIADEVAGYLNRIKGGFCIPARGAMYSAFIFDEGVLNGGQTLPIEHNGVRGLAEMNNGKSNRTPDDRFCSYISAATGVLVTPLNSGFKGPLGFRVCNLERDSEKRRDMMEALVAAANAYIASPPRL
ncbi:aminotransferase class I/II-fold pyridoxal phosphate-dependent enzyme, partial [Patescibacteria group bacterium]|nr:aminotransferase class I/II-fold pyridoxal phosphate-dependent enzyme [Patescibacteria group bacterium]